jgi:hypothetical protein
LYFFIALQRSTRAALDDSELNHFRL